MHSRWPWALAATSVAPLALRALAVLEQGGSVRLLDVAGFASDLAVSLLAAAVLLLAGSLQRALAVLLALLWLGAHYANYESVRVLGAPASLREAHFLLDPVFAQGSALAVSRPGWLAALALASGGLAWRAVGRVGALRLVVAGAVLALAVAWLPQPGEEPVWRQRDFLQRDATLAVRSWWAVEPAGEARDPAAALLAAWPELEADVSGAPRFPDAVRPRNVLLVVLESVSGIHLESFAREHGREPDAAMPRLDALAEESLRYVSFVAHQRKTNRGLYTLLCGELPNLGPGTPKMSAAAERPWRQCLPDLLGRVGFETAYLQAAPLAFMLKDRFLPHAGFASVDGHDWFASANVRSAWGVDDRAFFEQADRRVEELRAGDAPWLLTLLNVGTHHPYLVPEDFQPGRRTFNRAAAYLDGAFADFVARLEAKGVLEDTLLVVTSDESAGIAGFDTEPAFKGLSQSWGILLLRGPGIAPGAVREPFGLQDLPLTIADALGQAQRAGHFHGRSALRTYDAPRVLPFANANLGSLGALEAPDALVLCRDGACRRHAAPGGRYFGVLPEATPLAADAPIASRLARLAAASEPRSHRPQHYELLREPEVRLADDRPRMLHGGQFVALDEGEWLDVLYEVELAGDDDAVVEVMHSLTAARNERIVRERARLRPGERFALRYRFAPQPGEQRSQLQCRTTVRLVSGRAARLTHSAAQLRIRRGAGQPEGGLEVERTGSARDPSARAPRTSQSTPWAASSA